MWKMAFIRLNPDCFSQGCLEKGCGNFFDFLVFRPKGKITKLSVHFETTQKWFFLCLLHFKVRSKRKGEKGSKLNMFHHINHCFVLFPFSRSMSICDKCKDFLGRHTLYERELLIMFTPYWIIDFVSGPFPPLREHEVAA